MLGQREITMEDVTGILRRGWYFIVIPLVLCPLLALGVAYYLPAKYTSQSLVMIEQQLVPDSVVKSVVQENIIARVSTMENKVLSRSKLQPMIEKYGLYKSEVARGVGMDDLLIEMRENISVMPVPSVVDTTSAGGKAPVVVSQKISFQASSSPSPATSPKRLTMSARNLPLISSRPTWLSDRRWRKTQRPT